MTKYKDRKEKEAPYLKDNNDCLSYCSGKFFIKGRNTWEECKHKNECMKYSLSKNTQKLDKEVKFRYVDTFRNCNLYQLFDNSFALKICLYNMIYVNDLVCQCIQELRGECPKEDKEALKKIYALEKRVREHDNIMSKIIGDQIDFLADFNLYMDEQVQSKLECFRNSISKYLMENGVVNYVFIAYVESARTMAEYSIKIIEKRINTLKMCIPDIKAMRNYRLMDIKKITDDLSIWASRKVNGIDLNNSTGIIDSFKKLNEVLTDANILVDAINESSQKYS